MDAKQRISTIKLAAAQLDTEWPHNADLEPFTFHVYTQANAPADEVMLILAEALYRRGGKVVLYDANSCQRVHNLRTIPSVFVEHDGTPVVRIDIERSEDANIRAWLAIDGPLSPLVIKSALASERATLDAAAVVAEEEAVHAEGMKQLVIDTVAKDTTLSTTARAFMIGTLKMFPAADVAVAARDMMTQMGNIEAVAE